MEIKNSVAIVTGASGGIGAATAQELSNQGAKVVLAARRQDKLDHLAKQLPDSLAVVTDMTRAADIQNLIKLTLDHFGRVDILVNNAGRGYDAPVETIDPQIFTELFNLNVLGPVLAMQAVIPVMRRQQSGYIVNISSGTALMTLPNMSAYSGLKRTLVALSLTAREELKPDHIGVSVIYPYVTATDFAANTLSPSKREWTGRGLPHPADPPGYIAQKIVAGILSEAPQIFAHDWMTSGG